MNNFLFFDIAAFIIFITLIITTFFRKTVKGNANVIFMIDLFICAISTAFRIVYLSIVKYAVFNPYTLAVAYISLYIYMIMQNFILPLSILYIYSYRGIFSVYKTSFWLRLMIEAFTFLPSVYLLSNLITGKIFVIGENFTYSSTPYIYPIYLCAFLIIILGIVSLIKNRKAGTKSSIIVGLILYSVIFVCLFYQHIFPEHEISVFVIAMSFYLISYTTMRPELLLNINVHSGSSKAFYDEAKRNYTYNKSTSYILIKITNYKNIQLYIGHDNYDDFLNYIADWLNAMCKKYQLSKISYYLDDCLFAIPVSHSNQRSISLITTEVETILHDTITINGFEISIETRVVLIETPDDIPNLEYFVEFCKNFHHVLPALNKVILLKDFKNSTDFKLKNEIEKILESALVNDSFEIFYHPIFSIEENRFVSGEALLRLNDEYFGNITPAVFIPVAEKNGMIHKIGDIVFEKVFQFIASDTFKYLGLEYIEINLSAIQCCEKNIVERVRALIEKYKISPNTIRFEITENAADMNPEIVESNITALYDLGIRFTLDDYGTGYSNIKKVLSLPIDIVKLDKNFIQEIDNQQLNTIVNDTIEMLKNLNKKILIEGIENKRTLDHFAQLKYNGLQAVEYIQGYYFSRPLPQKDFVEFIRKD